MRHFSIEFNRTPISGGNGGILGIMEAFDDRIHSDSNPFVVDGYVQIVDGTNTIFPSASARVIVNMSDVEIEFEIDEWENYPKNEFSFVHLFPYRFESSNQEVVASRSTMDIKNPKISGIQLLKEGDTEFSIYLAIIYKRNSDEAFQVCYCKIDPQMQINN